jgi:hypothetical protein
MEEIERAKHLRKPVHEVHSLFISYCLDKKISIYSRQVFDEILKIFPPNEYKEYYDYCLWAYREQLD